jgi:hypothetical protein
MRRSRFNAGVFRETAAVFRAGAERDLVEVFFRALARALPAPVAAFRAGAPVRFLVAFVALFAVRFGGCPLRLPAASLRADAFFAPARTPLPRRPAGLRLVARAAFRFAMW